jgi:hypothetical protein
VGIFAVETNMDVKAVPKGFRAHRQGPRSLDPADQRRDQELCRRQAVASSNLVYGPDGLSTSRASGSNRPSCGSLAAVAPTRPTAGSSSTPTRCSVSTAKSEV